MDAALFSSPVDAMPVGEYLHDGHWYLDFGDGRAAGRLRARRAARAGGIQ